MCSLAREVDEEKMGLKKTKACQDVEGEKEKHNFTFLKPNNLN